MVLADTSVWVDHWRHRNDRLTALLQDDRVIVHPMVLGELALGALRARNDVFADLRELRTSSLAEHDEVLLLIEKDRLWGRGIGWVDVHLVAATLLDGAKLWTLDKQLRRVATDMGISAP